MTTARATKSSTPKSKGAASTAAPRGRFADLDKDKLRGGYYTSAQVAEWLCGWAIQSADDTVLEPSCGDGAFLDAAAQRLLSLGATPAKIARRLTGVEIIPAEARAATERLRPDLGKAADKIVCNSDFFGWWQGTDQPSFDVIVGNPPFIRYQSFPEPHRTRAMEIMGDQGLKPNRLTNIWVPFVVAATASLKPGGRLALVLPAEILQVTYAAQLRSYLTDHFARIDVIACNELFFENAEQEVVLLLADGALASATEENTCRVALTAAETVADITDIKPALLLERAEPKIIRHDSEKWLKYFLDNRQISFMRALRDAEITTSMSTHAGIDVGVVTGKNEFFVLSSDQIEDLGLEGYTTPLVSRAVQLKGSQIGEADWRSLAADGNRVHLLNISKVQASKLSAKLRRYIDDGERKEFHKGYKCSIREPWYLVPSVWVPDGFAFRQIYDFPRMVLNASGATSTDTIHRMRSHGAKPERVIANTYTWLTAASAEIEGRSYGGGVLELEPTEAERLLMPAQLNGAMPLKEVDQLVRAGRLEAVLEENARIILREHMGLTVADCDLLKSVWTQMRDRRNSRRRGARKQAA
ncbi:MULTISPECIES: Eco57I restriction-modification methylase domain-containing protein [unclassified Aurantimonas]|uniref:Eco57I restriction-modification methylase domain-containing protein n=1 Tax=unclassified Aurantimonas TaxID=2638230 RepID=UPI002E19A9E1|nr:MULTISPECIES: N-6 DNA methylase [unclassified Aurantimonas]MEC5293341.1 N-6 DNA methylase [Aurantimonas sp. C2-3-R2]MEC5414424.1 N-6 DNA methylase [Aurantimonas sp. C2-4-R8]